MTEGKDEMRSDSTYSSHVIPKLREREKERSLQVSSQRKEVPPNTHVMIPHPREEESHGPCLVPLLTQPHRWTVAFSFLGPLSPTERFGTDNPGGGGAMRTVTPVRHIL